MRAPPVFPMQTELCRDGSIAASGVVRLGNGAEVGPTLAAKWASPAWASPARGISPTTWRVAAPFIAASLQQHGFACGAEAASVTALMAFESVDFGFKHNVSPGRPGQGTANMQMAGFNLLYARDLPAVRAQVADVGSVDGQSNQTLNRILSLVQPDEFNFGSGAWFLRTQCQPDVVDTLRRDPDAGFAAHMKCVGVDVTPERKAYFDRAKAAFGLPKGGCETTC